MSHTNERQVVYQQVHQALIPEVMLHSVSTGIWCCDMK